MTKICHSSMSNSAISHIKHQHRGVPAKMWFCLNVVMYNNSAYFSSNSTEEVVSIFTSYYTHYFIGGLPSTGVANQQAGCLGWLGCLAACPSKYVLCYFFFLPPTFELGHITHKAPDLIRTPKLSCVEPG